MRFNMVWKLFEKGDSCGPRPANQAAENAKAAE